MLTRRRCLLRRGSVLQKTLWPGTTKNQSCSLKHSMVGLLRKRRCSAAVWRVSTAYTVQKVFANTFLIYLQVLKKFAKTLHSVCACELTGVTEIEILFMAVAVHIGQCDRSHEHKNDEHKNWLGFRALESLGEPSKVGEFEGDGEQFKRCATTGTRFNQQNRLGRTVNQWPKLLSQEQERREVCTRIHLQREWKSASDCAPRVQSESARKISKLRPCLPWQSQRSASLTHSRSFYNRGFSCPEAEGLPGSGLCCPPPLPCAHLAQAFKKVRMATAGMKLTVYHRLRKKMPQKFLRRTCSRGAPMPRRRTQQLLRSNRKRHSKVKLARQACQGHPRSRGRSAALSLLYSLLLEPVLRPNMGYEIPIQSKVIRRASYKVLSLY